MFPLFTGTSAIAFDEHSMMSSLPKFGGLYVISRPGVVGRFHLYIGKADDFDCRVGSGIARHEHWSEFLIAGATTVSICRMDDASARDTLESALIAAYCPPINSQHNWLRALLNQTPQRRPGSLN